jgi:hypothetical protein
MKRIAHILFFGGMVALWVLALAFGLVQCLGGGCM